MSSKAARSSYLGLVFCIEEMEKADSEWGIWSGGGKGMGGIQFNSLVSLLITIDRERPMVS